MYQILCTGRLYSKRLFGLFPVICLLCVMQNALPLSAQQAPLPTVESLLKAIDDQYRMDSDITAHIKVTEQRVDQGTRIMEMTYYRRDRDDAFLIVITAPEIDKGKGYLRVQDNMLIYLPNTRTFQKITRDEKIGNSDLTAGDVETRKYSELYKPALDANGKEIISNDYLGSAKIPTYKFEVVAQVNDIKYPKQVVWVTQDTKLILKVDYYSGDGTLMQTALLSRYTQIQGHYIALLTKIIDQFEVGNSSLVELSGISLDPIPDYVFTTAYMENLSK